MKQYDLIAVREYYPDEKNPGNSVWAYDQVIGLQKNGLNSLVISPTPVIPFFIRYLKKYKYRPKSLNKICNYRGTEVIRPAYLKLPGSIFRHFNISSLTKPIYNTGKNYKPKLIHAHFGRNGVASIALKKKLNIPLVTGFYGDDVGVGQHKDFLKILYKKLIIEGDLFIALSNNMKLDLIDIGFPAEKIVILHLGINIDLLKPTQKEENRKVVFTTVGRFHKFKGGQDTLSAFSKVYSIHKNIELHIVGDGYYINNLKNQVKSLNLEDSVVFINNFVSQNPRKVVLDEISNCDVFLLTTFQNESGVKTGTPVVLMEAQAYAKPCISTLYAGIPEIVKNNETGFIVKQRDIDGIARSMIRFIEDKELRSSFGEEGRKHIMNEFNQKKQMKKRADLYKQIIKNFK
ncbi:MAG: glycosyltransferase [Bacteroidales bacterium]|nr:glycosyltransferase [Bacteroidales bacterium]